MRINSHSFIRFDTDRQVDAFLSLCLEAPEVSHKAPRQRGFCFFGVLYFSRYSIADSL